MGSRELFAIWLRSRVMSQDEQSISSQIMLPLVLSYHVSQMALSVEKQQK